MSFIKDFCHEFVLMFKPYYKYIRFFIVFFLFFTSSIFQLIPISIFKLDINNINDKINSYLTLFSVCVTLLLVCIFYFKELKKSFKNLNNKISSNFFKGFKYWLIGLFIMIASNILIKSFGFGDASNDIRVINNLKTNPIIYGSITLLLTPILEELVFRLSFKDIFKYKWLFILFSGIIFGSIHVFSSLTDIYQLFYLIPYCSLGIAFSYMYYDTDNIFIPISFHILHNILVTISIFLLAGGIIW